ncbi:MAG: single-stranded DNA-binding protein [Ruminococcaceae bacterium]|nr:single-stranded DNA-binding protein [Oscillospiraceae bacterium]
MNKAILVGRLTKDPELRSTQSGVSVVSFSVAVTRSYARQGEERQTDFINCVAFRNTADFISRYFSKGSMIGVDGSIQTRTWDDQEGKRHWVTEVMVNEAHFVESKRDSAAAGGTMAPVGGGADLPMEFGPDATDDDLPF